MPSFFFKAVIPDGESVEEDREAPDEQAMIRSLQADGYLPIRVVPAGSTSLRWLTMRRFGRRRISQKDIGLFTRELATLLSAGLPLDRSLAILTELTEDHAQLHGLTSQVLEMVKGGAPLSAALEAQTGVFSRFYLNMIRAGEAGGGLEEVLERLSDYIERSKEIRDTVVTAMIYPAILVTMAVFSLLGLLTFVVPQFTEMFASAGQELPLPTQIVVAVADGLQSYWWALLALVVVVVSYMRHQLADSARRHVWDRRFLRLPVVGDLIRKVEVANFSRTLGTLLRNGVSLLVALSIVKETLGNLVMAEAVGVAADRLKEGQDMTGPISESELFPKMAVQMIKLGEETGRLEEMLDRVASAYDKEIKMAIQRMLALLEPILIVGLGLLIGGIIASILMAIMSVNDLAF